jgi:hypothetical protein
LALHCLGVDRRSKADLEEAAAALDRQQKNYAMRRRLETAARCAPRFRLRRRSSATKAAENVAVEPRADKPRACTGSKVDEETRWPRPKA